MAAAVVKLDEAPVLAAANYGVLPLDILYDVLLRLPADELCRLRIVCRSWRSRSPPTRSSPRPTPRATRTSSPFTVNPARSTSSTCPATSSSGYTWSITATVLLHSSIWSTSRLA
ncbi:hypothetical protein ACP70R_023954 [Stipagrostis hirtigluma subsp. patula]